MYGQTVMKFAQANANPRNGMGKPCNQQTLVRDANGMVVSNWCRRHVIRGGQRLAGLGDLFARIKLRPEK